MWQGGLRHGGQYGCDADLRRLSNVNKQAMCGAIWGGARIQTKKTLLRSMREVRGVREAKVPLTGLTYIDVGSFLAGHAACSFQETPEISNGIYRSVGARGEERTAFNSLEILPT